MQQKDYFEAMPYAEPEGASSFYGDSDDTSLCGVDTDYQSPTPSYAVPYLSDEELEAIADMQADYEEQRALDQAIIKEQLEKRHREE